MYKLLIVEDEEIIRRGLRKQISWEELGFTIVGEAENGKAALEIIPELMPDVVLTDVKMPVINGIELMKVLKETYPCIRVVILSGYSEFEYAQKGIEYGAFAYILKPTKEKNFQEIFTSLKNEMDKSFKSQDQFDDIKNKAQERLIELRGKIISDILNARCSESDKGKILKYLGEMNIPLDMNYGVINLEIDSLKCLKGFDGSFYRILNRETCEALKHFDGYRLIDIIGGEQANDFFIILASTNKIASKDPLYIARRIKEGIDARTEGMLPEPISTSIGISSFYHDIFRLNTCYYEARIALSYKFFVGKGKITHIGDCIINNNHSLDTTVSDFLMDEEYEVLCRITGAVLDKKINEAISLVNRYFEMIKKSGNPNPDYIYIKIIQLLIMLSSKLREKGYELKKIYKEDYRVALKKFILLDTISDVRNWVSDLLVMIKNYMDENEAEKQKPISVIDNVRAYIDKNYNKKISLEDAAGIAFMNPSYFSNFFKQKTGKTFIEYVTMVRVNKAKELLKNPEMKIYEVAGYVGYDDFRHFSKVFKKHTGINPLLFRENEPVKHTEEI